MRHVINNEYLTTNARVWFCGARIPCPRRRGLAPGVGARQRPLLGLAMEAGWVVLRGVPCIHERARKDKCFKTHPGTETEQQLERGLKEKNNKRQDNAQWRGVAYLHRELSSPDERAWPWPWSYGVLVVCGLAG